jgi:hypothetical protein
LRYVRLNLRRSLHYGKEQHRDTKIIRLDKEKA